VTVKEKKNGAIQNFKETTGRALKEMPTTYEVGRSRKTIVIRNIDPVADSCEVRIAIAVALGISEDAVQMHTLKLNKENETQVATASLIQKDADSLLQKKKIRIGWTRCPVYEIVVPVRCYRCHKYGHRAKEGTSDEGVIKTPVRTAERRGTLGRSAETKHSAGSARRRGTRQERWHVKDTATSSGKRGRHLKQSSAAQNLETRWVARDVGTAVIQKKRAAGWTGETYVACAAKKGM
jgi:hypothetical protein